MVTIEIDGKQVRAEDGAMVIEAADGAGIYIPRFCYHKKLSVAANCRMCLVEVEKARKPLPACATPVTDGMKVFTRSPAALSAQKGVMEFLLINHPLDCPICDQGGECELQDIAMGYGGDVSRFTENKRVVKDKNIGPLIATDMTRCIHCTRCVRFGEEIAGIKELGATGRGEHMEIGTYVARTVSSELSGNVIDLCPVGALTSKPFRFSARAWEMQQYPTIAPHDSVGSNIDTHTRRGRVMRVVPRDNEEVNETWIADRDRFSYEALYSDERVTSPLVKEGDTWKTTDWETALNVAAQGLKDVLAASGASQMGALASASATTEELYLFQKLMRALGVANIDHRLRQVDFTDQERAPRAPTLGMSIAAMDQWDAALLIGSNTRKDQPILGHRLRKAAMAGAKVSFINPLSYEFLFPVQQALTGSAERMVQDLAGVAKALVQSGGAKAPEGLEKLLANAGFDDRHQAVAQDLHQGQRSAVVLGSQAVNHPHYSTLRALAEAVAQMSGARFAIIPEAANTVGAHLTGVLPHRGIGGGAVDKGLDAWSMLETGLKGYVLMGVEPEVDSALGAAAEKTLQAADFVLALSAFRSQAMDRYAKVILPIAPYAETSGTYINAGGQWQSFNGAAKPWGESRPAWKVLRVLGNLLDVAGFDYMSAEEVLDEFRGHLGEVDLDQNTSAWQCPQALPDVNTLSRVGDVPIYAIDGLVRRAPALQATVDAVAAAHYMNAATAQRLGVQGGDSALARQGERSLEARVVLDERVPDGCVYVPVTGGGSALGPAFGRLDMERA